MTDATPMRRRRSPMEMPSHRDILDSAEAQARDAVYRTDLLATTVQRVEKKLDELLKSVGSENEDEHGDRVGTGVVGRLMRLEHDVNTRFRLYDGWSKMAAGFGAAAVIFGSVIGWLVLDKLSHLLR
jgi:hypothetical protein